MTMSVLMLLEIAQLPPAATGTNSPTVVTNAFGEMLHALNDYISIIEASPFPSATALRSPKISVLPGIHPCQGLVVNFPSQEPIPWDSDDKEYCHPPI
uniref:Uncharacterized protein n=1 Tax=Romanomermis culicivorax TaxID=13658 RepID=A0A915HVX1_ROMCU